MFIFPIARETTENGRRIEGAVREGGKKPIMYIFNLPSKWLHEEKEHRLNTAVIHSDKRRICSWLAAPYRTLDYHT